MISYELAKQLKEAGFPQNVSNGDFFYWVDTDGDIHEEYDSSSHGISWDGDDPDYIKKPTLSELIEACGIIGFTLVKVGKNVWEAMGGAYLGRGSTPEEAVAKLWLELNKKTTG